MRRISTIILLGLGWAVLCLTPVSAQLAKLRGTTPEARSQLLTYLMKTTLGLSDTQQKQVNELNLKYARKMQPIIDSSERPIEEVWEMEGVNKEKEVELKQVLTPEQYKQYLASKDEIRQKFEQRFTKAQKPDTDPKVFH